MFWWESCRCNHTRLAVLKKWSVTPRPHWDPIKCAKSQRGPVKVTKGHIPEGGPKERRRGGGGGEDTLRNVTDCKAQSGCHVLFQPLLTPKCGTWKTPNITVMLLKPRTAPAYKCVCKWWWRVSQTKVWLYRQQSALRLASFNKSCRMSDMQLNQLLLLFAHSHHSYGPTGLSGGGQGACFCMWEASSIQCWC